MNPEEYCRAKVAPEGSSLHYALLFAPRQHRLGLLGLAAFRTEVLAVPREVSDAGVAAVKLTWWQEELTRLTDGVPRHPVTQALASTMHSNAFPTEGLNEVIEAARMDLEYGSYPTLRELTLYCHRAGGGVADLARRLSHNEGVNAASFAHDLAIGLELTRMLRHLRRDLAAGRCYIPNDELSIRGLSTEALLKDPSSEAARSVITQQARRAQQFLNSAINRLSNEAREQHRYGLILAVLYRALIQSIEQDNRSVVTHQHHLTPLRKLWLAWRTARAPQRVRAEKKDNPAHD